MTARARRLARRAREHFDGAARTEPKHEPGPEPEDEHPEPSPGMP